MLVEDALLKVTENSVGKQPLKHVSHMKILLFTTSMTKAEAERCFSTLKRLKTFLRTAKSQDRLNALAMLSIEKHLLGTCLTLTQEKGEIDENDINNK